MALKKLDLDDDHKVWIQNLYQNLLNGKSNNYRKNRVSLIDKISNKFKYRIH